MEYAVKSGSGYGDAYAAQVLLQHHSRGLGHGVKVFVRFGVDYGC